METGFFSEEKCSVFCNQAAELDVVEGSIFDRLVSTGGEFDPLTTLWDQIDDDASVFDGVGSSGETSARANKKEDFNKMLNEWQEHLSSLQVLDGDKLRPEISDMFSVHPTVSIDELFPVECPNTIKEELILKDNCDNSIENEDLKEEGEINSEAEDELVDTNICTEELIKKEIKAEPEDECIDIETVGEKITVLEAGDVKTLLEQFEASEAVNTSCKEADKQQTDMSHQNIRDALPKEVIDRIKASTRKKMISLIPPKPTKNSSCSVTRLQDAAVTLCHNKLLKLVSNGESVQLDHDYCSGTGSESLIPPPRNFYQTDVADYTSPTYSRLPDYYVALAPQKALDPSKSKDWTEKNSKKDSGLESGDVSDASEEVPPPTNTLSMVSVLKRNNLPQFSASISTAATVTNTVVSTTTSSTTITNTSANNSSSTSIDDLSTAVVSSEPVRKRKLNLEEYRSRREERERIRSQECSRTCSPDLSLDSGLSSNTSTSGSVTTEQQQTQEQQQKVMHSVEVQATPEDIENNDSSRSRTRHSKTSQESSRRRREYRTRRVSSSSSSCSPSRRSKQRSSQRIRKNSNSEGRNNGGSQTRTRSIWSRSRSPSSSSRSSCSTCTSRSRSPLHNDSRRSGGGKWNSRPLWRTKHRFNKSFSRRESWRNQRSSAWSSGSGGRSVSRGRDRDVSQNTQIEWSEKEKIRQVEERRVIYVGRIEEGTTKAHLRERFSVFGPIIDISVHFREHGDNYGFVTFAYKVDAYEAVEHGNDDPLLPHYDLSFGGRRAFCKQRYADLDGERNNKAYGSMVPGHRSDASFDSLLREAQAKLNKRSSV